MKPFLLVMTLLAVSVFNLFSQDIIVRKSGERIECKITGEDSLNVNFAMKVNGKELSTYISKSDIQEIIYEKTAVPQQTLSESSSDSIVSVKKGLGYQYFMNGEKLTGVAFLERLKSNDQSWKKYNQAKGISLIANIFAASGGACIGWPLGTAIGGGDPNWVMAGVGVGLVVVGVSIAVGADKKIKQAVDIYNQGISAGSVRIEEIRFGVTADGIGLCMRF
jgi:hypothetical protein